MKWTDIVTAISSVVSNIIALAALSSRYGADHAIRDDERVPSRPSARNPGSILFHGHHENKHHIRRLRHHMRPAVGHARLRWKPWQAGLFGLAAGIWSLATLAMDRRGGKDD